MAEKLSHRLVLPAASALLLVAVSACSSEQTQPAPSSESSTVSAWSDEDKAMASYVAADTVSRYLTEPEVTKEWQKSYGTWGTDDFKRYANSVDPSWNEQGTVTGVGETNFELEKTAIIVVESTTGTYPVTVSWDDSGQMKVSKMEV